MLACRLPRDFVSEEFCVGSQDVADIWLCLLKKSRAVLLIRILVDVNLIRGSVHRVSETIAFY